MPSSPSSDPTRFRHARTVSPACVLDDFTPRPITLAERERIVWTSGTGPAVIVIAEMPGISPDVVRFARWVRDAGLTVYLPSLFGGDGAEPDVGSGVPIFRAACVSREFRVLATGETSPVVSWLRALAVVALDECGGPGVGAVGMCFTGNFALSMMLEPAVRAPVLCQPSLPLDDPAAIEMAPDDLRAVRERMDADDLTALGVRFAGDRFCTAARFAAYAEALGDRFVARVLPDDAANPSPPPFFAEVVASPHSVVTAHLIDAQGEPTVAARDEIIDFLTHRLHDAPEEP